MRIFKHFLTKLCVTLLFCLILLSNSNAKNTKLTKGNSYENYIIWKGFKFNLPEGEWIYYDSDLWDFENWRFKSINFISTSNRTIKGHIDITYLSSGGKWTHYLGLYLLNAAKNDRHDNCTLRPEYFYSKLQYEGINLNCFTTRHLDLKKELYYPDDPEVTLPRIKSYIKNNSLTLPKTGLAYDGIYYSHKKDKGMGIQIIINPEFYGAPKTLYGSEDKSEYHRNNIDNYPIKKIFFNNWTKKMTKEHQYLENKLKGKENIEIDFSDLNSISKNDNKSDFIEQLKQLNDLFKSGGITKEEFKKAKKKLLENS